MHTDVYHLIGYAWWAVLIIWVISAFTSKRTVRTQSTGSRLGQLALGILAALFFFNEDLRRGFLAWRFLPSSSEIADLGFALTLAGIAVALWARFTIGRNWSGTVTLKEDHQLIRSGPYSVVRHPIYSGILLALLGTVIAIGEVRALIALAIATLTLRLKSATEESFMLEQFGSQYVEYKHRVKALIPYLW